MSPEALAHRKAFLREWHRQNLQRIKDDPERYAKLLAQKNAARARRRAAAKLQPIDVMHADLYRAHGPWAPLFVIQQGAA